jgi:hypothetical protein
LIGFKTQPTLVTANKAQVETVKMRIMFSLSKKDGEFPVHRQRVFRPDTFLIFFNQNLAGTFSTGASADVDF